MKITWKWLAEYVDLAGLTPEKVADDLTGAGIPVEKLTPMNQGVTGVVIGLIQAVNAHPQADRLHICEIEIGDNRVQIVTGATNVQSGQKVPVALVGAKLPGKNIELALFRGVPSQGMLCSAAELGLDDRFLPKDQAEGIWILPDDAPIGEEMVEYLGLDDVIMELELTPNRSDCLSLRGVAFEVGALYSRAVHMPEVGDAVADQGDAMPLAVRIETDQCTGYSAQVVKNLKLGPSPIWMQMRLLAVGMRPINNLVDITNYVMFEWGQPLHAFDYHAIADQLIVVRQARDGEVVRTLDGQDRELAGVEVVIADTVKGLGLAGVMGGENSEVTSHTTAVVIESAMFDPIQTRRTSRQLQLRSEASLRFEKGLDAEAVLPALLRAASLMVQFAGGSLASAAVITGIDLLTPKPSTRIRVRIARIAQVLGYELDEDELVGYCKRLGLPVEKEEAGLMVSVPSRRPDLLREEDMIEEFARLAGFERIPSTMMEGMLSHGGLSRQQKLRRTARDYLRDQGFDEVWTYSFVASDGHQKLKIDDHHELAQHALLLNPLSEERRALRTTMLSSLLEVAKYNASRQINALRVFEIGAVFLPQQAKTLDSIAPPLEKRMLSGIIFGANAGELLYAVSNDDFYDLKGLLEGLLQRLGADQELTYVRATAPYFHSGRAAELVMDGKTVGELGQLRKEVATTFDLVTEVFYFQIDFDYLLQTVENRLYVTELPRFPQVERDLAIVVQRSLPVAELLQTVKVAAGVLLESVSVFDVYTGDHVRQEEKSVALRLVFRSQERTLTEHDVLHEVEQVLLQLNSRHGAVLRK